MTFNKIKTVVNKHEITKLFLDFSQKTQHQHIKQWLQSNAKNYFLKNQKNYVLLSDYDIDFYSNDLTVKKALEKKEELVKVLIGDKTLRRLEHIVHYFENNSENKKIERMSYPEAFKQSLEWTKKLNKKTDKNVLKQIQEEGLKLIHTFENGYKLVKLNTKENFDREGKLMRHCVAGYYERFIQEKSFMILSIRDKENKPLATIEARMKFDTLTIEQIKGRSNREVYDYETAKLFFDYLEQRVEKYTLMDESALGPKIYDPRKNKKIPLLLWDKDGIISDNLNLGNSKVSTLPPNLTIKGNLILENSSIVMLEDINVQGYVNANNSCLSVVSDNTKIGEYLYVKKESLLYYPQHIKIISK